MRFDEHLYESLPCMLHMYHYSLIAFEHLFIMHGEHVYRYSSLASVVTMANRWHWPHWLKWKYRPDGGWRAVDGVFSLYANDTMQDDLLSIVIDNDYTTAHWGGGVVLYDIQDWVWKKRWNFTPNWYVGLPALTSVGLAFMWDDEKSRVVSRLRVSGYGEFVCNKDIYHKDVYAVYSSRDPIDGVEVWQI